MEVPVFNVSAGSPNIFHCVVQLITDDPRVTERVLHPPHPVTETNVPVLIVTLFELKLISPNFGNPL